MKNKILVVAVHPDDETLGCGGTLLKHKSSGDEIYWLIVTGMTAGDFSEEQIRRRDKEIEAVHKCYGFKDKLRLELPAAGLDGLPRKTIIEKLSGVLSTIKPQVLYFPFYGDAHSDHKVVSEAVQSSLKIFRCPSVKRAYMMETISETEIGARGPKQSFMPNYFVDITKKQIDTKVRIMKIFKSEMKKHPFPRSQEHIRALAVHRGAMAGCYYAESFIVVREIW